MTERIRQFILVLGDAALLYLALFVALSLRYQKLVDENIWNGHWPTFSIIFLIWLIIFYIAGFYTLTNIRNDLKFYITGTQTIGIGVLVAMAYFYISPTIAITPKTILLLTAITFALLWLLWRRLAHRSISSLALKRRVLMIGENKTVEELTKLFDNNPQLGYEMAVILPHNPKDAIGNLPDYRDPKALESIIKKYNIATIVMDGQGRESKDLIDNLFHYLPLRLEFISLDRFYEAITKRISLETIDQFWFLENLQEGAKRLYDLGKRIVDIAVAITSGIISLALLPLISLAIFLAYGRPIFFTQKRLGKDGEPFLAIKFRTMVRDAEKNGPQWASLNDPRITALGKILRKTRLDEIPQLWNVVRGEMSFVGPRPERPEFVAELEKTIPFYRERLLVKPGLTGWAQINYSYGASAEDAMKKLQYDLYYIKNRSLILDIGIILRTIKTVLSAGGR
ncbi:MAG: sugar transferase [Patescibacteria group bacterium]